MVAISMYRGNLHRAGDDAAREWQVPPPTISPSRFRRLLRSRNLAVARLAGAPRPNSPGSSPNPRLDEGAPGPAREADEVGGDQQQQEEEVQQEGQHDVQQQQQEEEGHDVQQQEVEEEGQDEQQQVEEVEEQEEGAVEDMEMDDVGEVVVGGGDASGNGDPEEGQGESEGFDPNPEVRLVQTLASC
jgi:hypothetical protein